MEEIVIKIEPPEFLYGETGEAWSESPSTSSTSLPFEYEEPTLNIKQEPSENSTEIEIDPLHEFTFESDHPALKNNCDYKKLMETIALLEMQRSKAIKDLDRLCELQEEALAEPIAFVERLQKKENMSIPGPQVIPEIPVIDWSKYSLSNCYGRRQQTRLSSRASQDLFKTTFKGKFSKNNDQKPTKMNQYWTAEEQKRLEELLIQFPPEEIESRRWEKIASCLENRTPIQVASRVQKYFIRLMKAGIPIPGRMPSTTYMKKAKRNIIRQQPSTFMVSHTPIVYMPEAEDHFSYLHCTSQIVDENSVDSRTGFSDEEEINPDLKDTPEFKELMVLKRLQREKLQTTCPVQHLGFQCDRCKVEPIVGTRYHCTECMSPTNVDFCENCAKSGYEFGQHTFDHTLEPIGQGPNDHMRYTSFLGSDFKYLDSNHLLTT